jgi:hypothetical protein
MGHRVGEPVIPRPTRRLVPGARAIQACTPGLVYLRAQLGFIVDETTSISSEKKIESQGFLKLEPPHSGH